MKRFNYEQHLNENQKKYKISLILFFSLLALIGGCFVTGILISTYHNQNIIMIIFSIVLAILTIPTISILLFGVIKYKNERNQIFYILGSYLYYHEGKIIQINRNITTLSGRKGIEIVLETKNGQLIIYYDPIFGDIPFSLNTTLKTKCSESFIVQYEVEDE